MLQLFEAVRLIGGLLVDLHVEVLFVDLYPVIPVLQINQILSQVEQLSVPLVIIERDDGNPIIQLVTERVGSIIHQQYVLPSYS